METIVLRDVAWYEFVDARSDKFWVSVTDDNDVHTTMWGRAGSRGQVRVEHGGWHVSDTRDKKERKGYRCVRAERNLTVDAAVWASESRRLAAVSSALELGVSCDGTDIAALDDEALWLVGLPGGAQRLVRRPWERAAVGGFAAVGDHGGIFVEAYGDPVRVALQRANLAHGDVETISVSGPVPAAALDVTAQLWGSSGFERLREAFDTACAVTA